MLVLTRCKDETIMIGENIEVTVTKICGRKVRLGIAALKQIPIYRKEIYKAIHSPDSQSEKLAGIYS